MRRSAGSYCFWGLMAMAGSAGLFLFCLFGPWSGGFLWGGIVGPQYEAAKAAAERREEINAFFMFPALPMGLMGFLLFVSGWGLYAGAKRKPPKIDCG